MDDTTQTAYTALKGKPAREVRKQVRLGAYRGQTAGLGLGMLQGNLVIVPEDLALDFARFCQRNPTPCPLVGVSDTGDPRLRDLGADIDIRCDVPLYNVYRDGALAEQVPDITHLWTAGSVAFVLGCSFTFEDALMAAGIRLRHIERKHTVPMYRTALKTRPAGAFTGEMVVSMRPLGADDAVRAAEITAKFPHAHGAPVHMGDPKAIGIHDLDAPDWGDATEVRDDEIPVFWACGVTPQAAVQRAKPALCITHAPGRMLITDMPGGAVDHRTASPAARLTA